MYDRRAYLLALVVERAATQLNALSMSRSHLEALAHALYYSELEALRPRWAPRARVRSTWPGYRRTRVATTNRGRRVSPRDFPATKWWSVGVSFDGDELLECSPGQAPAPWALAALLMHAHLWLELERMAAEEPGFEDVVSSNKFEDARTLLLRALRWRYDLRWLLPRPKVWRPHLPKVRSPVQVKAREADLAKGSWWMLCHDAAAVLGLRPRTTVQVYVSEARQALPGSFGTGRRSALK